MSKSPEHGYLIYPPNAACCPSPSIRVDAGGSRTVIAQLHSRDEEIPEDTEVLEIEHLAPGIAEVKQISGRPAMVNSRAFQEGWERLFDPNRRRELAQA